MGSHSTGITVQSSVLCSRTLQHRVLEPSSKRQDSLFIPLLCVFNCRVCVVLHSLGFESHKLYIALEFVRIAAAIMLLRHFHNT